MEKEDWILPGGRIGGSQCFQVLLLCIYYSIMLKRQHHKHSCRVYPTDNIKISRICRKYSEASTSRNQFNDETSQS
jgi:hypothetical protein